MNSRLIVIIASLLLMGTDSHAQWEPRANGLPSGFQAIAIDALDSSTAVVTIGQVYRTTNGGALWQQAGSVTGVIDLSISDASHIWAATLRGEIFATTDGGITWTKQFVDSSKSTFMNYIEMFDANVGIAMGDALSGVAAALFLKTTDGGAHWTSQNDSAFGGYSFDIWRPISFPTSEVGFFYAVGVNPRNLWKTTDAGGSWTKLDYPGTSAYRVSFTNTQVGVACPGWTNQVFRTLDGGASWEVFTLPSSAVCEDVEFVPGDLSKVWLSDNDAIRYSNDTCRTWTTVYAGRADDIVFTDEHCGWAAGMDSLLLRTTTGGLTSVSDPGPDVPVGFALSQNYPNPFNPKTVVSSQLPVASWVRLVVYDLLGREVAVLMDEYKAPGTYRIEFDGAKLASGVYVYRLRVGSFVESRKAILLR